MSDRDPEHIVLKPRDVRWDWTGPPMHHVDGDPFLTHFANVLNILLPEGEEWFLVLDGEVAHHGSGTARRADDAMLICVSRAAEPGGRLTLDL
jgi:predicted metal-dependent hydrolase